MSRSQRIIDLELSATSGFYSKRDVAIVEGKGALLWDAEGNLYIDCASGHGAAVLGHRNEQVVRAVNEQCARLITCQEALPNDARAEFQSRLLAVLPGEMDRIFLCNSGTEAVEAALKIALLHTGRDGVIAAKGCFHGRTAGALALTWNPAFRNPFRPHLRTVKHIPFNNVEALTAAVEPNTGAVILEVVQGEGGVHPCRSEFFRAAREVCDLNNLVLIIDEIQTGFGRTGKLFACEHFGLAPDLVCLAKGIAAGLPMGAVGIGAKLRDLPAGSHGSTFGGNPLCCAAGLATLESLDDGELLAGVLSKGRRIIDGIRNADMAIVKDVRGLGLMIGIELRTRVTPVLRVLMSKGIIALPAGPTVLRLLPPLVIDDEQVGIVLEMLKVVLGEAL